MITGIVVALPEELGTLTAKKIAKGQCDFIANNILVACAGAGSENASKAAKLLISKGAKALISWGCAGALSENLKPGDLILPQSILTATAESIGCDKNWLAHLQKNLPIEFNSDNLIESFTIIETSEEKTNLHQQSKAVAVDMESAAIAKTAAKSNIPTIVIRTIADPVSMSLPSAISYSLNAEGEVVLRKLLIFLLTHPQQIPALIKLGLHFNAAKNKLKAVAKHLDTITSFHLNISA